MFRALGRFEWGLAALGGGLCLMAILVITVGTVFGRYVLHTDLIPGGYNIIEGALFPLLVFWGLPLAHREGSFPRLEALETLAPGPVGRLLGVLVLIVELGVYAVVTWYCGKFAWAAWETGRQLQIGTGYWQAWPVFMMAPLSFALMLIEVVRLLVRDARRVVGI